MPLRRVLLTAALALTAALLQLIYPLEAMPPAAPDLAGLVFHWSATG
jgi:hypothetical protein